MEKVMNMMINSHVTKVYHSGRLSLTSHDIFLFDTSDRGIHVVLPPGKNINDTVELRRLNKGLFNVIVYDEVSRQSLELAAAFNSKFLLWNGFSWISNDKDVHSAPVFKNPPVKKSNINFNNVPIFIQRDINYKY